MRRFSLFPGHDPRSLGVRLHLLEARGTAEFDGAFAAMVKERAGALFVITDPVFSTSSHETHRPRGEESPVLRQNIVSPSLWLVARSRERQ